MNRLSSSARPGVPPARCATIDVGTNTVLSTIFAADAANTRRLRMEEDLHFVTGLGRGREPQGRLSDEGQARASRALEHIARRCEAVGIASGDIEAATTAAVREAPNGRDFVRRVLDGTGIALRVVPGEEEADLVALAQERSFPQGEAWLVLDVGGGSTELALRTPGATRWARSLPTGSVKLGDRYGSDVAQLEAASWATVPELLAEAPPAEAMFVGVAGTVTTALQLTRGWTTWDPARLLGARLELDELRATRDRMAALPAWDRRRVPGLHPGRADYVVAGLTLLLVILERLGRRHLLVSDRGVRYGLLWKRWSKATL